MKRRDPHRPAGGHSQLPVYVRVDEVRVDNVGTEGADLARERDHQRGVEVRSGGHDTQWDATRAERLGEAIRLVGCRDEHADVQTGAGQSGEQ